MNEYMLRRFRRLGIVPRWTVVPTLRRQTVDQHSYQVAQIARQLLKLHSDSVENVGHGGLQFEVDVICYALDHDYKESETGDTPSPAKPAAPMDTDQVKVVVKCADILEALMFLAEESVMGNSHYVQPVVLELRARFHDWWQRFDHRGSKPLSSDVIRWFELAATSNVHPAMEARKEAEK